MPFVGYKVGPYQFSSPLGWNHSICWVVTLRTKQWLKGNRYHLQNKWWCWCLWSLFLGRRTAQPKVFVLLHCRGVAWFELDILCFSPCLLQVWKAWWFWCWESMCFMGSSKYKTPNATFPLWCQVILICWECPRVGVVQSCGQKVRHQVLEDSKETNKMGEKMQHISKKPETFNLFEKTSKWMIANFHMRLRCWLIIRLDWYSRLRCGFWWPKRTYCGSSKTMWYLRPKHRLSLKWVGLRGKNPWTQLDFPGDLDEPTEFTRRRAFNFSWSLLDLGWVLHGDYSWKPRNSRRMFQTKNTNGALRIYESAGASRSSKVYPPRKLTWPLKNGDWETTFLSEGLFLGAKNVWKC